MTVTREPMCFDCIHFKKASLTCKAFPEKIPDEIFWKRGDHTVPYPGDNGIQFEAKLDKG
jgi:hypothetical protein